VADNTTLNTGSGGDTISTDDIGGSVKVQRVKVQYGVDGAATDVSDTNPMPVDDAGGSLTVDAAGDVAHDAADSGNPLKVGGKAAVSALPTAVANGDRANLATDRFGRALTAQIDPGVMGFKAATYTTQQTGAALWTPAAGKCIAVSSFVVASFGTTAFRCTVWFGAAADTTYTEGTDKVVVDVNLAPSASVAPGVALALPVPICSTTADHVLRVTTDAAGSVRVQIHGYEFAP
jgi:hypothetical protein